MAVQYKVVKTDTMRIEQTFEDFLITQGLADWRIAAILENGVIILKK